MSVAAVEKKQFGVRRQWLICALMVGSAWILCAAANISFAGLFAAPIPPSVQALVAAALCLAACANAWFAYRFAAHRPNSQHIIESYSRLDLRGWNPFWLSLAAGVGEEILFRGALQSVAGIGVSSVIFVLAHTRAYRFNGINRRVLVQALGLLGASLVLAVVARYAGLLSAIVLHTVVDVFGLLAVRHLARERAL